MPARTICRIRGCGALRFGNRSLCKEHHLEKKARRAGKAWYVRRTEGNEFKAPSGVTKLKLEALDAYGSVCVHCGNDDPSQLQLDHVEDNGSAHRRLISGGRAGAAFYRALKSRDWPNHEPYELETACLDCHITITTRRRYEK